MTRGARARGRLHDHVASPYRLLQDPSSVFIFVTSGYLAASPASQMMLVNGARASNGERRCLRLDVVSRSLSGAWPPLVLALPPPPPLPRRYSVAALVYWVLG